jgi:hypothetical protein
MTNIKFENSNNIILTQRKASPGSYFDTVIRGSEGVFINPGIAFNGSILNYVSSAVISSDIYYSKINSFSGSTVSRTVTSSDITSVGQSFIYCAITQSNIRSVTSTKLGQKSTAKTIIYSDINRMNSIDTESSTWIYLGSTGVTTKVMGTTGAPWVIYIDNTGTINTDLATN